jgi:hypothetical protein
MDEAEHKWHEHGPPKAEDIEKILKVVSERIPSLVEGIMGAIYSEAFAKSKAKAVATFYSELKAGGIPNDVALKMTEDYVSAADKWVDKFKQMDSWKDIAKEKVEEARKKYEK